VKAKQAARNNAKKAAGADYQTKGSVARRSPGFWVGLVFLLINGAIGQARVIPSESMQNTLLVGDHLIMSRVGYDVGIPFTNLHVPLWRNPKRGADCDLPCSDFPAILQTSLSG